MAGVQVGISIVIESAFSVQLLASPKYTDFLLTNVTLKYIDTRLANILM